MVHTMRLLLAALLLPALVYAQEKPFVEIGTNIGATVLTHDRSTITRVGIPGQDFLGQPSMYLSFFAGDPVLVEPRVALSLLHSGNSTYTTVGFGAQVGYLFNGSAMNSPFVGVDFGFQYEKASSDGDWSVSDSDFGLGGKVGYRFLIGRSVGLRVEGGYRRWVDSELNEFNLGIGIGGIVHRTR
jgi:hypothetical protein